MSDENETKNIVAKNNIDLTDMNNIDLSNLSQQQLQELTVKNSEAKLELTKNAAQSRIDLHSTIQTLDSLTDTVKKSTSEGTSATITHTQTTSLGRTEIIMGNTERAAKGKISRSATGEESENTKYLFIIGGFILAIAIIVSVGK
jgi:hypothetical protein